MAPQQPCLGPASHAVAVAVAALVFVCAPTPTHAAPCAAAGPATTLYDAPARACAAFDACEGRLCDALLGGTGGGGGGSVAACVDRWKNTTAGAACAALIPAAGAFVRCLNDAAGAGACQGGGGFGGLGVALLGLAAGGAYGGSDTQASCRRTFCLVADTAGVAPCDAGPDDDAVCAAAVPLPPAAGNNGTAGNATASPTPTPAPTGAPTPAPLTPVPATPAPLTAPEDTPAPTPQPPTATRPIRYVPPTAAFSADVASPPPTGRRTLAATSLRAEPTASAGAPRRAAAVLALRLSTRDTATADGDAATVNDPRVAYAWNCDYFTGAPTARDGGGAQLWPRGNPRRYVTVAPHPPQPGTPAPPAWWGLTPAPGAIEGNATHPADSTTLDGDLTVYLDVMLGQSVRCTAAAVFVDLYPHPRFETWVNETLRWRLPDPLAPALLRHPPRSANNDGGGGSDGDAMTLGSDDEDIPVWFPALAQGVTVVADFPPPPSPPPFVPPALPPRSFVDTARAAGAAAGLLSAAAGSVFVATLASRSAFVLGAASCGHEAVVEDWNRTVQAVPRVDSPTGLRVGKGTLQAFAGACMGNVLLLTAILVVHGGIAACTAHVADEPLLAGMARVRFPSLLAVPGAWLFEPTVRGGVAVLRAGGDEMTARGAAVMGLLAAAAGAGFVAHQMLQEFRARREPETPPTDESAADASSPDGRANGEGGDGGRGGALSVPMLENSPPANPLDRRGSGDPTNAAPTSLSDEALLALRFSDDDVEDGGGDTNTRRGTRRGRNTRAAGAGARPVWRRAYDSHWPLVRRLLVGPGAWADVPERLSGPFGGQPVPPDGDAAEGGAVETGEPPAASPALAVSMDPPKPAPSAPSPAPTRPPLAGDDWLREHGREPWRGFVARNAHLFAPYRQNRHWFLLADLGVAAVVGVAAGYRPTTRRECQATGAVAAVACAAYVATVFHFRPFAAPFDAAFALGVGGLQVAAVLLALAPLLAEADLPGGGVSDANAARAAAAATHVAAVALLLLCVKAAADAVAAVGSWVAADDAAKRVNFHELGSSSSSDDGGDGDDPQRATRRAARREAREAARAWLSREYEARLRALEEAKLGPKERLQRAAAAARERVEAAAAARGGRHGGACRVAPRRRPFRRRRVRRGGNRGGGVGEASAGVRRRERSRVRAAPAVGAIFFVCTCMSSIIGAICYYAILLRARAGHRARDDGGRRRGRLPGQRGGAV